MFCDARGALGYECDPNRPVQGGKHLFFSFDSQESQKGRNWRERRGVAGAGDWAVSTVVIVDERIT